MSDEEQTNEINIHPDDRKELEDAMESEEKLTSHKLELSEIPKAILLFVIRAIPNMIPFFSLFLIAIVNIIFIRLENDKFQLAALSIASTSANILVYSVLLTFSIGSVTLAC
jgi:hypothetical protein